MKKIPIGLFILVSTFLLIFSTACNKSTKQNIPTVITTAVTGITSDAAIAGGNVVNDQGEPTVARGVCFSTSPNPTILDRATNVGGSMWEFTSPISGLTPNTKYYLRAYATLRQLGDERATGYGGQVTFTTLP